MKKVLLIGDTSSCLQPVELEQLAPWKAQATRAGVDMKATKNTTLWFKYRVDGEMVGFCGLLDLGRDAYRLRAAYILPQHRGKGYGQRMVEERIELARMMGAKRLHTFSYRPALFYRLGFQKIGQLPNGATSVEWRRQ